VIITSSSDEKIARALGLGADHGINYRHTPEWGAAVLDMTSGRGADVVLDVTGPHSWRQTWAATAMDGLIVHIGALAGADDVPIAGSFVRSRHIGTKSVSAGSRDTFEQLCRALAAAHIHPYVDDVINLPDFQFGLERLSHGDHLGKLAVAIA
jgi:NADPH:quinone reductase-like Zn-dependent oxidoreductase